MDLTEMIIRDCDQCFFKNRINRPTTCQLDDSVDVWECTYGKIPIKCPLRKGAIVFKLEEGVEVMPE